MNMSIVLFERKITTNKTMHTHIQLIGIPSTAVNQAIEIIKNQSDKNNYKFEEYDVNENLSNIVGNNDFFYFNIYQNGSFIHKYIHFIDNKSFNYNVYYNIFSLEEMYLLQWQVILNYQIGDYVKMI